MPEPQPPLRRPRYPWEHTNGFKDRHPHDADHPDTLQFALDKHRLATIVLTQKDRAIPSLEEMEKEISKPATSHTITQRIQTLKSQHLEDLQRLYDVHAGDYITEAQEMRSCKDDAWPCEEDGPGYKNGAAADATATALQVRPQHRIRLEISYASAQQLYTTRRHTAMWDHALADDVSQYRYAYLQQLLSLTRQHQALVREEEEARRRKELEFPKDPEDFKTKPRDLQMKAAKFLTATDRVRQERMMVDFDWKEADVFPLKVVYEQDAKFSAEIRAMVIEVEVRDPRKKKTL
ncbi:hypothetical protein AX16_006302 [Volvariella volvacea WC 439]|nr:hypothetical protein AX16_006302 [Volvariella volvacea WC 439]